MNIVQVIAMVNQMQADDVVERYAIGGAVGATFHLEPVSTLGVARPANVLFCRGAGWAARLMRRYRLTIR